MEQPSVTFTMKEVSPVEEPLRKTKPAFQASVKQSDNPFKNLTTVNVVQNVVNYNITKTNFPNKQGAQLSRSFVARDEDDEDEEEAEEANPDGKILDFELDSVNVTVLEPQRPSIGLS